MSPKRYRITIANGKVCFWNGDTWLVYCGSFTSNGIKYVHTPFMYDREYGVNKLPVDFNKSIDVPVVGIYPYFPLVYRKPLV